MADWPYSTARWLRLRRAHLDQHPQCEACEAMGRLTLANTVDHRVPISAGGPAFPGHDGLASYCTRCHSEKTARGVEAGAVRTIKPRRGCDPSGAPLDPAHQWHGKIAQGCPARTDAQSNIELVQSGEGSHFNG